MPEKLCAYISLQWWQERRQEEYSDLQRDKERNERSKIEMSSLLATEGEPGQWKSGAMPGNEGLSAAVDVIQ